MCCIMNEDQNLLEVEDLRVHFPVRGGVFRRAMGYCKAVDGVSFSIPKGKTFGLVGESGCGKSTLAKAIVQLVKPTAGKIRFKRREISEIEDRGLFRKSVQMVFQDPAESLNTRMTVSSIVQEPLDVHKVGDRGERAKRVEELLEQVGLPANSASKYPFEFSGGQRQRIGIARALALKPELLVLDEPVSALDVSVQSQVLNLLMDLQENLGLSYLLISHDLAVVKHISDIIAVMYLGKIVELGPSEDVYASPLHAYTKALIASIAIPEPGLSKKKIVLTGDVPSPINPPPGCAFGHRTQSVRYPESLKMKMDFKEITLGRWVLDCPCCLENS